MARTKRDEFGAGSVSVGGLGKRFPGVSNGTVIVPVPDQAPGPLYPPPHGRVKFRPIDLSATLEAALGEEPPTLTPQLPRIETVETPWRMGQSWWQGQERGELTISIMFDAWPYGSVEKQIKTLESMLRPSVAGQASKAPPPWQIAGNVPGIDRVWMPVGVESGDAIWRQGYRVRARFTLTFAQWQPVERAETASRSNPRSSSGDRRRRGPVTVRRGDTLPKIAQRELGSAKRWKEIAKLNPRGKGKNKKPRRSPTDLKVGEKLKLPQN